MADMSIELLLFAEVARECGTQRLSVPCEAGSTVDQLLAGLTESHPQIAARREVIAVAVNECYVNRDHVLHDGDTIAIIPPVSGG